LDSLEEWDEDVRRRYPDPDVPADAQAREAGGDSHDFRNYEEGTRDGVREFYRQNHRYQTLDFVRNMRAKYLPLRQRKMGIWEAMRQLSEIVDDSDPDTEVPQIEHAIQSAEGIRQDGHPDWFVLTGLIHDLGKVLCLFGEPQWAVVGDTFPVGCAFSEKIVLSAFFAENSDVRVPDYQTPCGIYQEGRGLEQVLMSWGHDEYLFQVVKDYLPTEALYMIRYHSFYAAHRERAYGHLMDDRDREMFRWVRKFNRYDLYTKTDQRPDLDQLLPRYERLVAQFFPEELQW
jgi:inositol oxygenase